MSLYGPKRLWVLMLLILTGGFQTSCGSDLYENKTDTQQGAVSQNNGANGPDSENSPSSTCLIDADCIDYDACTDALCSASGICSYKPRIGVECDDDNCCSTQDKCQLCVSGDCPTSGLECRGDFKDCDDDNRCTLDECICEEDSQEGHCSNLPLADGSACAFSDSDCTTGDQCLDASCVPGPGIDLDDKNPCTLDTCKEGAPHHEAIPNAPCEDGDACTIDDRCVLGECTGGSLLECLKPECAASISCISGEGCVPVWKKVDSPCDDNIECTLGDICNSEHECTGNIEGFCDDSNPCTADSCEIESGLCRHTPQDGECEDDDPCTTENSCIEGICQGSVLDCSYLDNQCIKGICNGGECINSTTPCDDGDPCTEGTCDSLTGECSFSEGTGICDDEDPCTVQDFCESGICAGIPMDCSDLDTECLEGYCEAGACLAEAKGDCLDGESCETPIDLGESGGTVSANLCDYAQDYSYGWCDMEGPELIIQLKAKYKQGKLLVNKGNSFEQMVWNYRFLGACDSEQVGYCYAPDNQGAPGWGGYNPDTDLYIAIGSTDGSCGEIDFSVQSICNAGCSKSQICTPQGKCCEPGTLCTPGGECCGEEEVCVSEECVPAP